MFYKIAIVLIWISFFVAIFYSSWPFPLFSIAGFLFYISLSAFASGPFYLLYGFNTKGEING